MADAAHDPIVIVGTARTAIGGFQGALAPLTAPQLGSVATEAAVERAGLGARQAALGAGLPSLNNASRIASCSACIVRSMPPLGSHGLSNPLESSRSLSFDMSSSMSRSSSGLGTYFEYLNFMA